jgi:glucose-6-phosphate-specific signal transduction histidine kinase
MLEERCGLGWVAANRARLGHQLAREIEDHGRLLAMPPGEAVQSDGHGWGLSGMHERSALFGGEFQVRTALNQRT